MSSLRNLPFSYGPALAVIIHSNLHQTLAFSRIRDEIALIVYLS